MQKINNLDSVPAKAGSSRQKMGHLDSRFRGNDERLRIVHDVGDARRLRNYQKITD